MLGAGQVRNVFLEKVSSKLINKGWGEINLKREKQGFQVEGRALQRS